MKLKIVNINLLNIKMSTQLELDFGPEFTSEPLPQLNSGHYLELMDRLYIMMNNLNDHAVMHPLSDNYTEVKSLLLLAMDKMWAAYQLIGNIEYTNINK
mgnify:FL=1